MSLWIESHSKLRNEPKVYELADSLAVSVPHAIGLLHLLWWLAVENTEDGQVGNIPTKLLARELHHDDGASLLAALKAAGFIDADGKIHNWMEYAGRLISDRKRKRAWRMRMLKGATTTSHPVEKALKAAEAHVAKPSEKSTAFVVQFERFWEAYPKKKGKGAASTAFRRAMLGGAKFDEVMLAVAGHIQNDPDWKREGGQFIPHPSTWLNQKRWQDAIGPVNLNGGADAGDLWKKKS